MAGGKFGVFVLVARQLGTEGQGAFALSLAFAIILSTAGSFGFETANIYFVGRDRTTLGRLLGHSFSLSAVLGITGAALAWAVAVLSPLGFSVGATLTVMVLVGLITVGQLLFNLLTALCTGLGEFRLQVLAFGIRYGGAFLLVLSLTGRLTLEMALAAWFISLVVALCFLLVKLWPRDGSKIGFSPSLARAQFAFGMKSHLDKAASLLTYRLDLFLVAGIAGTSAAGLYSVAQQAAEVLLMIARGSSQALLSEKLRAVGQSVSVRWIYVATLVALVICMVPLGILAGWLVPALFGPAFAGSVDALRILLPGVFAMTVGILAANHLIGFGRPGATAYAGATALVVTVVLDLLLIPRYGIIGAAIASTLAYTAYAIVTIVFLRFARLHLQRANDSSALGG